MKPLASLESSALAALKTALDGYQRYQQSFPEGAKYFHQIIELLVGSIDGLDIWAIRTQLIDEDKRRGRNATVKIVDPHLYDGLKKLSPQELRVLKLVGEGHHTEPIAELLGISYRTVTNHKSNIAAKLGLASVRDLVKCAIDNLTIL